MWHTIKKQGWGAGAGRSRLFWLLEAGAARKKTVAGAVAAWKKKSGAGAANKLAGSPALREDKKHKEIVLTLLFFR